MSTEHEEAALEQPGVRTRTLLHLHVDDDTIIVVDHVFLPEGAAECDECGKPAHDPGMVGVLIEDNDGIASALMPAGDALILADRIHRAASLVLESGEEPPDIEREVARYRKVDIAPVIGPGARENDKEGECG